ncbi:MAG TPA: MopE-related protein, partial [Chitinophagales bacterium]|nr:MopE-related protein [Chitinophagales bacterium]
MNSRILIIILAITCLLLNNLRIYAQDPLVLWDNTIGGESNDYVMASAETPDGGFILGGYSSSEPSFDKTEFVGFYDYWVVKLNSAGTIEWETTIGTTATDNLTAIVPTSDGGYLLGGYTPGGITGDKTDPAIGLRDYWIIKLGPTGEIVWQKTIGGTGDDYLTNILPLTGTGFIISGYSSSGISGNKTAACIGGFDYWVLKINAVGNIVWQFTIGGTGNDYLFETIRNNEGNYVLAGYSNSGISGNKTEANIGGYDFWALEIDGVGTVVWQNTIGGIENDYLNGICELNTGGYILAGISKSNNTVDKSENSLNYSDNCAECEFDYEYNGDDFWVVKIDAVGNLIWDNTYLTGGDYSSADVAGAFQYEDNKIMIYGNAKGGYDNLETDGGNDYWLLVIDTNSYVVLQQVLGGEVIWEYDDYEYEWYYTHGESYLQSCFLTSDGGFFVAGSSNGNLGNDKSEAPMGEYENFDYWVLKLGPDTCIPTPIYADNDQDGEGENFVTNTCEPTYGPWINNTLDCDDRYASVNSMATEICDNLDNDCDGLIDEGLVGCVGGPQITWDKTLGDTLYNSLNNISATNDGGTIAVGFINAYSEENIDGIGDDDNYDIEIYKLDAEGYLQWKKIITADDEDRGIRAVQTTDGGYIIGAYSGSGVSGDKTVYSYGNEDYWIIKLNTTGEIVWQKAFGGTSSDILTDIESTPDGGVVIAGYSYSGISGNKTENVYGSTDFWVLKLNASGDIEWQNNIGGYEYDYKPHIAFDNLGNYYVGGTSYSNTGGDKTEMHQGSGDYWAIKLNNSGSIIWQNTLGGSLWDEVYDLDVDDSGSMILMGTSSSGISPDKAEVSLGKDYWVIKLKTDGSIDWENTINASNDDYGTAISVSPDGGYLIGGNSNSISGTDKIEPYITPMFNSYFVSNSEKNDFWILKLDSSGNIIWQNTIGGNMGDFLSSIAITNEEKIFLGGTSKSGKSADKSEMMLAPVEEKIEEDDWGNKWTDYYANTDFWIVQLQPENCTLIDELCNTLDDNCNGLIDDDVLETITISAAGDIEFCQGGSVSLTATYSGTSLQWQKNGTNIPGATLATYTVTTKGNYTCVTTSDCGTATSDAIFVNVFKNPAANVSAAGPTTFCVGESVTLNVTPVAGCSYQWYKDASPIPGATETNYLATTAGIYKCRVTKTATGCFKTSAGIIVTVPCKEGLPDDAAGKLVQFDNSFKIQPNPTNGTYTISAPSLSS